MKKIISLALATAMVFTMSAVAFAAGSVSDTVVSETEGIEIVGVSTYDEETTAAIASMYADQLDGVSADDVEAVVWVWLDAGDDWTPGDDIVLQGFTDFAVGDIVKVMHLPADAETWQEETAAVTAAGEITLYGVTSCSPFIFFKVADSSTSSSSSSSVDSGFPEGFTYDYPYGYWDGDTFVWNGYFNDEGVFVYTTDVAGVTTAVTSPVTGETNAAAVAACMMLLAGVAVCGLVRKEQL